MRDENGEEPSVADASDESKLRRMNMKQSTLGPDGFTQTHRMGYEWAEKQVLDIRNTLGSNITGATGHVWAYRHDGCEMLAVHISCDVAIRVLY